VLGLVLPCVLALGAIAYVGWLYREDLALPQKQRPAFDRTVLARIAAGQRVPEIVPVIAFFGDSFSLCGGEEPVGPLVQREVTAVLTANFTMDVSFPAFRPLQFYYLLADVLAAKPQVVIVEVNLPYLCGNKWVWRQLRYHNLSRKLDFRRAVRVREALALDSLTPIDPWLYRLEEESDTLYLVDGVHDWGLEQLKDYGRRFNVALGLRSSLEDGHSLRRLHRFDASMARSLYLEDQASHPMTAVLRQIRREVLQSGAEILFYVSPMPVDLLDSLGVREEFELPARIERVRRAIGAEPDEWLDLHALIPGDGFKDWAGHMKPDGCRAVAREITDVLARRGVPRRPNISPQSTVRR
jgi:hypothetical protein